MHFTLLALFLAAAPKPAPLPQLAGKYKVVHRDFTDTVTLNPDGSHARANGDGGTWSFDGKSQTLLMRWKDWGTEDLSPRGPSKWEAKNGASTWALIDPPKYDGIPGSYQGTHPHWKDSVALNADGTYARGNGDPGMWIYTGKELVLWWKNWGPETLTAFADGTFSNAGGFKLSKSASPTPAPSAPASKHLAVDKPKYKVGEAVTVTYKNMPGNGTDWTNVIVKSGAEDDWGNWSYVDGPNGTRVIKGLTAGTYEARAYYNGGTTVEDRVTFTVEK